MNYQIFNSKQLNPNQLNSYYNLPINTQNQNIAFPNQTIYPQNILIQNHIYNYQGKTLGTNYINKNYFWNNQGNIRNNFKSKISVVPIFGQTNEMQKYSTPFTNKPDSGNKIKIIFKNPYQETQIEVERNVKFAEVAPNYYEYLFNGKIIDKSKTLAELGIYNNSEILEIDQDVQDLLIIDQSPISNGNNSEKEKQIVYFYFIIDQEKPIKYKMLIQSKKVRNLWEVFLYFNKKIGEKLFNIISFIAFKCFWTPTVLNQAKSLNELEIENGDKIFIMRKQNMWIIDENPLITQEDYGYKYISKEQLNIIKIFIINDLEIIIIQCSQERKFKEILLYLEAIFDYNKQGIVFRFNGETFNQDKTLCELGIKNGSIIKASHEICFCINFSTEYFLKDKNKKVEKKYIAIKFNKNGEVFKFICQSDKKFKEISLKFMKEAGSIK